MFRPAFRNAMRTTVTSGFSRIVLTLLATAVLTVQGLPAQAPATQAPPPPQTPAKPDAQQPPITFRVEVNYVEIDATVTDEQGDFVRNLTKDDFEITEEGTRQEVSLFSLVDIPLVKPDAPLFSPTTIEPDVRTNQREFDGRVYVIILDDLHTSFARSPRVRAAAKQFIQRYLGENDLAAILQTGGSTKGVQEFTSSKPRLLRAVDAFMGQKLRSATLEKLDDLNRNAGITQEPRDISEPERAHKARVAMGSLKNVADYLAGIRGRRKAVIYFSEGIDYDISNPIQNRYATDILEETKTAIAAATRGNVSFYSVDPRGLGGNFDDVMDLQSVPAGETVLGITSLNRELLYSQDSLRILSDETGGVAFVNRNDFASGFARIVQENSSYYVLAYYSKDVRRDGRFRRVDVKVKRPGLRVRARKGYTAPRGRPESSKAVNAETSAELREAIDSPVPISGLGISVFAAPMRGTDANASVVLALEIQGDKLRFAEKQDTFHDDVEVAVVAVDQGGKVRDGGRDLMNLRLRPQTHALVARNGVRILRRLDVPPGRYVLRIGARETGSGAVGSVTYDLDVPDFSRGGLALSGLFLASASASQIPTANPDPEFKDVMRASPAAVRDFPRGDQLSYFAEVYDNQTKIAHKVSIKATIIADDGKVVYTNTNERSSTELQGQRGGYGYSGDVSLKEFAPGRYVFRVEARALVSDSETSMREVEFRVR
jgi:VWFA-related protein